MAEDVIDRLDEILLVGELEWADRLGIVAAIEEIRRLRGQSRGIPPGGFDNSKDEE